MDKQFFIAVTMVSDEAIVKETLQRIGIPNKKQKILYQTCHLIPFDDQLRIIHFKEYFAINNSGKIEMIKMSEDDFKRRNTIIFLLYHWKLINFINDKDREYVEQNKTLQRMFVLNYQAKNDWQLKTKINLNEDEEKAAKENVDGKD